MSEEFTVIKNQVDVTILVHDYNGHHFNGNINFKGHVMYMQKLREGLGNSITSIRDRVK